MKTGEIANPEALNPDHTEIVVHSGERKDLYFVPPRRAGILLPALITTGGGMTGDIVVE